jgi:hypothetical protein
MRTVACLSLLVLAAPLTAQPAKDSYTPWFPLKVGNKWTYRAANPSKELVIVEVEKAEPIDLQIKDEKTGKMVSDRIIAYILNSTRGDKSAKEKIGVLPRGIYRFKAGGKELPMEYGVYRFQTAGKDYDPPMCFLRLPPRQGESWEVNSLSEGAVIKGTFVMAPVEVPADRAPQFTVKSKDLQVGPASQTAQPLMLQYWFAENVGPLKTFVKMGDFQSELELQSYDLK